MIHFYPAHDILGEMKGGAQVDDAPIPPSKDDVLAILKAHRDLGPEYDNHLADQILDLWKEHPDARPQSGSAPSWDPQMSVRQTRRSERRGMARAIPFLGISIPLMAIAGNHAHTSGILAVVALDAVVVVVSALRG